jgi:hypothetical protein
MLSSRIARTRSTARPSYSQRFGVHSQDIPATSPGPSVAVTRAPLPGGTISRDTAPSQTRKKAFAVVPSLNRDWPSAKTMSLAHRARGVR